jgi:hypothetical protein
VSRPAVAGICAAVLLAGFIAGRIDGSGQGGAVTVRETVEHSTVVLAQHIGAARDPRDGVPLDLALVRSARDGVELRTTIVARRPWSDSLLRRGRVRLSILYDTNDDGRPDRRDVLFLFHGRPTSFISSWGQGVQDAAVTRPDARTIEVTRDATIFYGAPGQGGRLWSWPVGVAVAATSKSGSDRVPNRGWITVPAPR